ncbi:MAG TPA: polyhydroxyalkanoate synthesis regulator DNA-binding domain-containing protein [Candidatus Rifleibacterium sp.]|nr:polyhydroxyalkanoate synthesis regulator DNA-binding domain-containing protein [Candidatus Rifleibacterium sp.]HNW10689.1 polyhydroxyalkanoate synthesis regulator DNA-binding domain-containing protein [Candidatus Rifleibacterium sp.]HOI89683.1 polyhydroxyalkanoate synthesis regulator DNA-binding domain-containing protein [Candidatus Rifleibacterium sp.]HPW59476.1 polyhydroxyalkanoate synthesis regulator DNA-binding domain-containing protein [Candidatus Rifleibacterium sp.]
MKEILIKKYDNRRLYCVEEARYVSLTEIRDFLQRGDKVKVVEKTTGKDITKYILMQVMLEDRYELVPTYFYQMMLQSPPEAIENFFQQFFPWMMSMYKNYQDGKFSMPGMTMPGMPSMPSMPSMPFQNPWMQMPNPFQGMNPFMQTPAAQPQQQPQGPSNEASAKKTESSAAKRDDDKMTEILKRLRELEEKLHSD